MNTEEVAALSDEIVSKFKEMEIILRSSCTPREREIGMKQVKAHIRLCNKAIRSAHLSVGVLRKLQTNISHLKRFSKVIKPLNYTGAGSVKEKRSDRVRWEEIVSAFKSRVRTGNIQQFFNDSFYLFKSRIINAIKKIHMLKVNTCFCAEFIRKSGDTDIIEKKYFNTKNKVIDEGTDLKNWFEVNVKDCILNDLSEFSESGSGWALNEIINLELVMESHPTLNCRIKLQKNELVLMLKIRMKLVLLGVSLVPFIPLKKNTDRIWSYPYYTDVLNLEGIDFPIKLPQVFKFEKNNDISINIFGLEMDSKSNFSVVPIRLTKHKIERHVNLLIIQDKYFPKLNEFENIPKTEIDEGEEIEYHYHYCYIKDLSRLLNYQLSKNSHKKYFCDRCLNYFTSQDKLNDHVEYCEKLNDCKIEFSRDLFIKFKNFVNKESVPFIIYADFESLLQPFNDNVGKKTKSTRYQKHVAYSAGYYFKCNYNNNWCYYKSNRGADCMSWFANELETVAKFVSSKLKQVEPMNVQVSLRDATVTCHICEEEFTDKDKIVRDHCHLTGNFRGFAHNKCNLNYKNSFVIPVVFHNMGGYDGHFIIRDLAQKKSHHFVA
ncbi:hypothetical protein NQ318_006702 [Aromia moschata]|uniref:DNA-directed DNA polymerase n=1 Tax=Aromia moschata TaxID=1265417 RepID=A0AAV8YQL9_9CUCU|nr:hypothetical protein NQ318_006702 [Aromia moschata]